MFRLRSVAAVMLMLIAGTACATDSRRAVDLAAEEQAIREVDRQLLTAAQSGDAADFAALFAPDGQLLFPNKPAAVGRDAIRQDAEENFAVPGFSVSWEPSRYIISEGGDLAASIGTYNLVLTPPQGRIEDRGKYMTLWRKVNGEWLVAADMINTDVPMPAPDAGA